MLGIALTQIAQIAIADGDVDAAIAAGGEALELQEQIGYTEGTVSALHVLGQAHRLAGDTDARATSTAGRAHACRPNRTRGRDVRGRRGPRPRRGRRPTAPGERASSTRRTQHARRRLPLRQRDADELALLDQSVTAHIDGTVEDHEFGNLVTEIAG